MRLCKHRRTVITWSQECDEDGNAHALASHCADCNERLALGPSSDAPESVQLEMRAAELISWFEDGKRPSRPFLLTDAECDGYANYCHSPFVGNGSWWAGWLANAHTDHDQIQAQDDVVIDTSVPDALVIGADAPEAPEAARLALDEYEALTGDAMGGTT